MIAVLMGTHMPASAQSANGDSGWPRRFDSDHQSFSIYQPQVESWKDNQVQERAAVEIQATTSAQPVYGVVWFKARTEVDKSSRMVNLEDIQVTQVNFPSIQNQEPALLKIFQKNASATLQAISLDRLDASLSITKIESNRKEPELKNDPPRIIYSSSPALLVLIDGKPVLRDSGVPGLLRIINTRALILVDQTSGNYYFYIGNHWMVSSPVPHGENGPWKALARPSSALASSLDKAKKSAVQENQVDLLNDPTTIAALKKGVLPKIYVSTDPTELLTTNGTPQFEPVPDTQLLYVKNSASDLFLNTTDQNYYLLIAGRWFHSPSLEGKWTYVPPKALPTEFAKIPDTHPKGDVLASIPGTAQAGEAAISNSIPQTATVDRQMATVAVTYDGPPDFIPIAGTPLKYAANSPVPVIEIDPHTFYSVQNGVWFVATNSSGPWVVADKVPAVVYTIPPSSPLYYVTYVYVYGADPRYVYCGYLPGYLGSYVTPDGVVIYGTGYVYQPWIGSVWYGPPATFGFGVAWGFGFGWSYHVGYFGGYYGGTAFSPWWGPWRWAGANRVYYGAPVVYRNVTVHQININHMNVYRNWGGHVVRSQWVQNRPLPGYAPSRVGTYRNPNRGYRYSSPSRSSAIGAPPHNMGGHANNIYTDRKGNVFRDGQQGWQRYGEKGWEGGNQAGKQPPAPRELEQERASRQIGEARSNYFNSGAGQPRPAPRIAPRIVMQGAGRGSAGSSGHAGHGGRGR